MPSLERPPLTSLGLGGDGDEVAAIEDVEAAFGVKLNTNDAATWRTTGDVLHSLRRALPPEARDAPDLWSRFATAIVQETGVDATGVTPATALLAPPIRALST